MALASGASRKALSVICSAHMASLSLVIKYIVEMENWESGELLK
jgi:hypothetical protein